ncbi:MAG: DNA alkylation repair protein [Pseudomonadota bacterium]
MQLKEVYNRDFLTSLADAILEIDKSFEKKKFLAKFEDRIWAEKELKQRMRAITIALGEMLSQKDFFEQIEILKKAVTKILKNKNSGLALIIFPDFVEVFGEKQILKQVQDDDVGESSLNKFRHPELVSESIHTLNTSLNALSFFTEFGSSEFAIRKFLKLNQKHTLTFVETWSKSDNHHIRRLASEGCRPRLPWGEALQNFKKDPSEILPILENLKNDESAYVKKSVANNLNDISKDNPEIVLKILTKWDQENVDKPLIRHALRTLLKQGNKTALKLIGIDGNNLSKNFTIQTFALQKAAINISQNLIFDFTLENQAADNKIRLEYAVYFLRQNGTHGKKIFQITTKSFAKGVFKFTKKHAFRDMTTRKHNAGKHFISLVVNGVEFQKLQFDLI